MIYSHLHGYSGEMKYFLVREYNSFILPKKN